MDGFLLQDWTTIRGDAGIAGALVTSVAQSSACWLDLADYDDVAFYLDVREVTGTVSMTYQSAPAREEAAFYAVVPPFGIATNSTPRVDLALAAYAGGPLARYLRWMISTPGSGIWDATFRIWVAALAPGA